MPKHPHPPFDSSPSPSVVRRLAAWVGAIGGLALVSMLASMIVVELSSGEARAINLAGSLRMQSYVIQAAATQHGNESLQEALDEFEERFAHPDLHDILPHGADAPSQRAYQAVGENWSQHFRPSILRLHPQRDTPESRESLEQLTHEQVVLINQLVALIEEGLEAKLQFLRWVQGISLVLLVVVAGCAVIQLKRRVLLPLGALLEAARKVRRGDFSGRVEPRNPDELGQLGEAFNMMVADLSLSYGQLEQRVAEKTAELARSNQSLDLLYRTTRTLAELVTDPRALQRVLEDVAQVFESPCIALGLQDGHGLSWLSTAPPQAFPPELLQPPAQHFHDPLECQPLLAHPGWSRVCAPVFDGQHNHGWLMVLLPQGQHLAPWQIPLLQSVGHHVGTALAQRERTRQEHRLALLDERAVIARELHDSLAQSLSYLKIQVARLQSLLGRTPPPAPVQEVVDELRDGLSAAYRQLRELLTTFRLRMDGRGLRAALDETVQEFRRRSDLNIHLDIQPLPHELGPSREIHVLQIIREALSNVERHAHAQTAWVQIQALPDSQLQASVEDDGHGFDPARRPSHRYGINIMHDRAESLHGQLNVAPRAAGGTRVELRFPATAPANAPENPFKTP